MDIKKHPIYTDYAADSDGNIYSLKIKQKKLKQYEKRNGYLYFKIYQGKTIKNYYSHRFVYECFHNKTIDKNKEIDHINSDKKNNSIGNLQEITQQSNLQKRKFT